MTVAAHERPTEAAERRRLDAAGSLDPQRRAALGQFFTPAPTARLIASLLTGCDSRRVRLLDPGAGTGSLTAAAVEHLLELGVREIEIVAWEIDARLHAPLRATLKHCTAWAEDQGRVVRWELQRGDYIETTARALANNPSGGSERFDAIIMNPPYRKVNGGAPERSALEKIGLPITNLYTAFLALAAAQLSRAGVLAAITPRSFASGSYSAPFRHFFFDRVGLEQLHLFDSRKHLFADAGVLQENMVFSVRRGPKADRVRLSFSHEIADRPRVREVPTTEIIHPEDPQRYLLIPGEEQDTEIARLMAMLPASLADLGVAVSTGRVVEFRAREHLREKPEQGTAPLIRPNHIREGGIHWPDARTERRKPNALAVDSMSEKLLLPNETYVLVKRLTAKEEPRRVCAAVFDLSSASGRHVAFENHLNVFHRDNRGLPKALALGLAIYLNSSFVDRYVRQFNGHTQVNATDLRYLRYPSEERLCALGATAPSGKPIAQHEVDEIVDSICREPATVAPPRAA